jgi:predicted dinucleotide-binding enzyme
MKIGILGTGHVAGLLAAAWQKAGHEITLGSRDPGSKQLDFAVDTLAGTARGADVVVNAIIGSAAVQTISSIDSEVFDGKPVIDVTNALTPGFELVYPSSSVAAQLQQALPGAHVVKTMNTAAMTLMTNPASIAASSVFLSGDDDNAKSQTAGLLTDLGWSSGDIVDLGGIDTAGGPEHYFFLFFRLAGALKSEAFNIRVVK